MRANTETTADILSLAGSEARSGIWIADVLTLARASTLAPHRSTAGASFASWFWYQFGCSSIMRYVCCSGATSGPRRSLFELTAPLSDVTRDFMAGLSSAFLPTSLLGLCGISGSHRDGSVLSISDWVMASSVSELISVVNGMESNVFRDPPVAALVLEEVTLSVVVGATSAAAGAGVA